MKILKGLSFDIADLLLVAAWSEAQSMRMAIWLDHGTDSEMYEEVLALHAAGGAPCRWLIWHERAAVCVQPLPGRSRCYGSVVDALEAMQPDRDGAQTHIQATGWPAGAAE
jgi:hypothetical protein